jgi:hypothetical protein
VSSGAADGDVSLPDVVTTFVFRLSVLTYLVWYRGTNCSEDGSVSVRNVGIYLSDYIAVFALDFCSEVDWFESRTEQSLY